MSLQISMGDRKVVCRTCLKLLENIGYTYLDDENGYIANVGNIREMLQFCIPELDLHVSAEPVICYQCLPILVQVYNFKIKCLNGESMIRAYISRNNLQDSNHVNLNSVLMEELRMQNQKAQIENRIKHFMIQEASTNNSLNQNHFRCEENFDEIEKSIFEIEQPTPIDQNIGNTPDADTSTSENSDDSLKSQIKREFDAYQQNENVELNADMEDEIVEDSTEEVNNKVNTTEKHKSVVAVRKDLFDKSKNKVKKQPVLSNKVITKNGRIIIKIDRRRLQNITKTNLNKESSISTPNSASQEATVDKDFQVNSVPDPDDIELSFIQVDESSSSGSQKDNDSPQIYTCNKCSFITHDMIKMYDHNRTFHNFDYTCQHCPFSTSKVELLGNNSTDLQKSSPVIVKDSFSTVEKDALSCSSIDVDSVTHIKIEDEHHSPKEVREEYDSDGACLSKVLDSAPKIKLSTKINYFLQSVKNNQSNFEKTVNTEESESRIITIDADKEKTQEFSNEINNGVQETEPATNIPHKATKRKSRKRAMCPFCFEMVTSFPRHLVRKHRDKECVKNIMLLPPNNSKRKEAIIALRKKGLFMLRQETDESNTEDTLPCVYCLGYYKRTHLWKHTKMCRSRTKESVKMSKHSLSESQTLSACTGILGSYLDKSRFKNEVLNVMRADKISSIVKKDPLICLYGETQLITDKQKVVRISNKIRELARFKLALQKVIDFENLIEILNLEHYDAMITAVSSFETASLTLYLRSTLQYVCHVAKEALRTNHPLFIQYGQSKQTTMYNEIDGLYQKILTNWYRDILKADNAHLQNENGSPKLIPLIEDLKLINQHLTSLAQDSFQKLNNNENVLENFKILTECTATLTYLFNRRRREVLFLKIEHYEKDSSTVRNYKARLRVLTTVERALRPNFKSVFLFTKNHNYVPVLFTKQMQNFVDALLTVRKKTSIVPNSNKFLFAHPGATSRWINGSGVLRKFARECGVKSADYLAISEFRIQIGTIIQLLNFENAEFKQLMEFLGPTENCEFDRLPDDISEIAKIVEVVLAMNTRERSDIKEKKLEDIETAEDETRTENETKEISDLSDDPDVEPVRSSTKNRYAGIAPFQSMMEFNQIKKGRIRWTPKQKSAVLKAFAAHIRRKRVPKKDECLKVIYESGDVLRGVDWSRIKMLVYNTYRNDI